MPPEQAGQVGPGGAVAAPKSFLVRDHESIQAVVAAAEKVGAAMDVVQADKAKQVAQVMASTEKDVTAAAAPPQAPAPTPAAPPTEPPAAPASPPPTSPPATQLAEVKPTESKPESPMDISWSAIKKAEANVREQRKNLKAEMDQLRQFQDEVKNSYGDRHGLIDINKLKTTPLAALQAAGMSFNDIMKAAIAERTGQGATMPQQAPVQQQQQRPAQDQTTSKIAALEEQLNQMRFEQLKAEYKRGLSEQLADNRFQLLRAMPEAVDRMFDVTARHAELSGGEVLTPDRAAAMLHDEWQSQLKSLWANKEARQFFLSLDGNVAPATRAPAPGPAAQTVPVSSGPGTLTNAVGASPIKESVSGIAKIAAEIPADFWDILG
jgi:hypothetical protein